MFSFRKSKFTPTLPALFDEFEFFTAEGEIGFTNAENSWTESFNVLTTMERLLVERGHRVKRGKEWLVVDDGIHIRPAMIHFQPIDPRGAQTSTVIAIAHETQIPQTIFEYQHADGDSTEEALLNGFEGWYELDFPVILDHVRGKSDNCNLLAMTFPDERERQALLGPPQHMALSSYVPDEEHPYCPCCLLTQSIDAFKDYLERDGFYGIRLLALRSDDGNVSADCRINGEEYELGKEKLCEYARTWPGQGFEMRKQYVIIRDQPAE